MYHIVKKKIVLNESSDTKKESMGYGYIRSKVSLIAHHLLNLVRESSFNMTRGGDEDIETRSLKF